MLQRTCRVGHSWQRVNIAIRRSLQEITLLELAGLSTTATRSSALDRGITVVLGGIAARGLKREPL
jgi:DNA-binding IscR family transcriptional regulator